MKNVENNYSRYVLELLFQPVLMMIPLMKLHVYRYNN